MKKEIFSSLMLSVLCMILLCGFYPLVILAIAGIAPGGGSGITVLDSGKKYYVAVGQRFSEDRYFWSRPSAVDYNASGSGGSNKGPFNPVYLQEVQERVDSFLLHNPGVALNAVPSELVTASGSGLDPDISYEGAMVQVKRVSSARKVPEAMVRELILKQVSNPLCGPVKINVLLLNIALDHLTPADRRKK